MMVPSVFRLPRFLRFIVCFLLLALVPLRAEPPSDFNQLLVKFELETHKIMLNGNIPSAAVALVRGDEIIWSGAFGNANVWAKTPAWPNTVYLIGSTFKNMSTFALLKQMELGKFNLDDL
jgi:CubicO group peptidase (beta-lactamase class C family)